MKKLNVALASLVFGLGLFAAVTAPAHAASRLGGVSVAGACFNQWPGSEVVLLNHNVFGWKCRFWSSLGPVYYGVDLTQQCVAQYGSRAYAAYSDYNNPYSWSCYR